MCNQELQTRILTFGSTAPQAFFTRVNLEILLTPTTGDRFQHNQGTLPLAVVIQALRVKTWDLKLQKKKKDKQASVEINEKFVKGSHL